MNFKYLFGAFCIMLLLIPMAFAESDLMVMHGKAYDGNYLMASGDVRVQIYTAQSGGALLYDSLIDFNGAINNGLFDILLGSGVSLDLNLGQRYYYAMQINAKDINFGTSLRQVFQSAHGDLNADVNNLIRNTYGKYLVDLNTSGVLKSDKNLLCDSVKCYKISDLNISSSGSDINLSYANANYLKLNQSTPQTVTGGIPVFNAGITVGGSGDGGYLTARQIGWKNYRGDLVGQLSDSGGDGDHTYGLFALGGNSTESSRLGELDFYDRNISGDQRKGGLWGQYGSPVSTPAFEYLSNYYGNFSYTPLVPSSITGNYVNYIDGLTHTFIDDGIGNLYDDAYDYHQIGTVTYSNGYYATDLYYNDYIQEVSYSYYGAGKYAVTVSGGGSGGLSVDETGTTNISNYSFDYPATLYNSVVKIFASGAVYDQGAQLNWYDESGNEMGSLGNYGTNGYGTFLLEGDSTAGTRMFDFTAIDRSLSGDSRIGTIANTYNGLTGYSWDFGARISQSDPAQVNVMRLGTDGSSIGIAGFSGKVLVNQTSDNGTATYLQSGNGLGIVGDSYFGVAGSTEYETLVATTGNLIAVPIVPETISGAYTLIPDVGYYYDNGLGYLVDDGSLGGGIIGTIDYATGAYDTTGYNSATLDEAYYSMMYSGARILSTGESYFVGVTTDKITATTTDPKLMTYSPTTREEILILDTAISKDKEGVNVYFNSKTNALEYWNPLTGSITDYAGKVIADMKKLGVIKQGYYLDYKKLEFFKEVWVDKEIQTGTKKVVVDLKSKVKGELLETKDTPVTKDVVSICYKLDDKQNVVKYGCTKKVDSGKVTTSTVLKKGITFDNTTGNFYEDVPVMKTIKVKGTPLRVDSKEAVEAMK